MFPAAKTGDPHLPPPFPLGTVSVLLGKYLVSTSAHVLCSPRHDHFSHRDSPWLLETTMGRLLVSSSRLCRLAKERDLSAG